MRSTHHALILFAVLLLAAGPPAGASVQGQNDLLLSDLGGLGATGVAAINSAVAYNGTAREFLVVFEGREVAGEQSRIYGQRVDAEVGGEVGANDFLVSEVPGGPDPGLDAFQPAVAYNSVRNEYLVVFVGQPNPVATESEVFGQRIAADGTRLGGAFQVSDCGAPGDTSADVGVTIGYSLDIAYNATDDRYLVVWRCDDVGDGGLVNSEFEILARLVNGDGTLFGAGDFQVSQVGGANGLAIEFDAESPACAWNSVDNQFLVVWGADNAALGDGEREIFGQRLSNVGAEIGTNDFQISASLHPAEDSVVADVAHNPATNEYLVAWSGDTVTDNIVDIFAQRLTNLGTATGGRIDVSATGTAASPSDRPRVVHNTVENELLVIWQAAVTAGETEIFGQRLTATGAPVGFNDFRISDAGPNGNTGFDVNSPSGLAYAGSPLNSYLAVWDGDDDRGGQVDGEVEVRGQMIEPVLEVSKALTSATGGVDAEDTLTYQIRVVHKQVTEGADFIDVSLRHAFNLDLTDDLSDLLENTAVVSAEVSDGATTTDVSAAFDVDVDGDLVTTGDVDLLQRTNGIAHQELAVVVSGQVPDTVSPADVLPDTNAVVTWQSFDPGLVHPEYDDTAVAAPGVTIAGAHVVTKTALSTQAAIGDVVTFQLAVTVIEGTTTNLQLVDTLPAGLAYVAGSAVVANANGMTVNGLTATPVGQQLTLDVTSVVNPGDVDDAANADSDTFVLAYQTRVLNVAGNQSGTSLINDVDATADDVPADVDNQATVTVVEPELSVTKAPSDATPEVGDTVTYTVTVSHIGGTSTADAFDLVVTDTLPSPGLSYVSGSAVLPPGATVDESGDPVIVFQIPVLALADGSVVFTYDAEVGLPPDVSGGDALTNTQGLTWTSRPGADPDERTGAGGIDDYIAQTSATVTVEAPDLSGSDKTVVDASGDGLAEATETLTYTVAVVSSGSAPARDVVITDAAPAGTAFDTGSVQIVTNTGGGTPVITTGNGGGDTSLQVDVDRIDPGGTVEVSFTVTVDNPVPAALTEISNTADLAAFGVITFSTAAATLPVARPLLATSTKVVDDAAGNGDALAQPGETLTYTLTVANSGDGAALAVVLTDNPPTDTGFDTGSVQIVTNTGSGTPVITTGNGGGDASLRVDVDRIDAGGQVTVSFTVTVDDPINSGANQIGNTAQATAAGIEVFDLGPAAIAIDGAAVLATSAKAVSDAAGNGDAQAQPGEVLTYTVTVTNSGNLAAANVVVTDTAPTNTSFSTGSVQIVSNTGGGTPVITTGNGGGDTSLRVDIDAVSGGGGQVVVGFQVTVDAPLPAGVTDVTNTAQVEASGIGPLDAGPATIPVDASAALATSTKTVADESGDGLARPGETLTYFLTVINSGDQKATNVVLTDAAPANTTFVTGSVMILANTGGGTPVVTLGNGAGDASLQVDVDTLAGGGAEVMVSFQVEVDDDVPNDLENIDNSAQVTADGIVELSTPVAAISVESGTVTAIPMASQLGLVLLALLLAAAAWLQLVNMDTHLPRGSRA